MSNLYYAGLFALSVVVMAVASWITITYVVIRCEEAIDNFFNLRNRKVK